MALTAMMVASAGFDVSLAVFTDATGNTGSNFAADTLDPPTGLTAADGATITIDWTATTDTYATGHRILRSTTSGGPYAQIGQITPRATASHTDNPPAGTYYYVARAFRGNWESVDSNEDAATVGTPTPTIDATSSWTGSGATESWTHTVGSGSNRILIVTTASKEAQANSVTFNSQPMTLIGRQIDADGDTRISMWYRLNPATGPGTIEATYSSSDQDTTMGASSWTGVHQTTPIGTFNSQAGDSTTPSVTIASAAGEVVIDAVSAKETSSLTVGPSQTEHWNANLGEATGGHSSEAGASAVTMSWTMENKPWAIGAVTLKPA